MRLLNLETTSQDGIITECVDMIAHTNHYITDGLKEISANVGKSSVSRLEGCRNGLFSVEFSEESLRNILFSDTVHVFKKFNSKWGKATAGTFATVSFDIDSIRRTIKLKIYGPDKDVNNLQVFSLDIFFG